MRPGLIPSMILFCACGASPPAPAVVKSTDVQTRWAPSGKAHIEILARGSNAFLGRLTMDAGGTVPEHQDPTEEYIHVLKGTGTLTIDGWKHEVGPGDTVFMPAGATVSYHNGDEEMVAIQVFAGPGPADKYDGWLEEKP
jgi:quercetin dioxygenase-like cupin family protein